MARQSSTLPVIDFRPFLEGSAEGRLAVAREMRQASADWGFFCLANCGMPSGLLDQAFRMSEEFFALPDTVKESVAWQNAESNRGYVGIQRERLDPDRPGDLKEAFNMAPESPNSGPHRNLWPQGMPRFRQVMEAFLEACIETSGQVLEAFAVALEQPADFFAEAHSRNHHTLRLLHYPPLPQGYTPVAGESRAGAHTDYGSITLLFQDEVGGLEVRTRKGEWIRATPIPGTVVVNTGDLMHRWTNHVFCSTPHRVSVPPECAHRDRYSIAFFCHPNMDATIRCIDTCVSEEEPARYPPITAGQHLKERLTTTYGVAS